MCGTKSKSKSSKFKLQIHSYLLVLSFPIAKALKSYSMLIKRVNLATDCYIALIEISQFTKLSSKYKSNPKMLKNKPKQVRKRQKVKSFDWKILSLYFKTNTRRTYFPVLQNVLIIWFTVVVKVRHILITWT